MPSFSRQITNDLDDGQVNYNVFGNTNVVITGTGYGDTAHRSFLRFPNITIPKGSTITAASITVNENWADTGTLAVRISGAATDNAVAPTTAAGVSGTTLTTAQSGIWAATNAEWAGAPGPNTTPSLVSVVQELVNRSGWAAGNAMMFLTTDAGSTGNGYFEFFQGGSPQGGATLNVTYDLPPGPTVNAGADFTVDPNVNDTFFLSPVVTGAISTVLWQDVTSTPVEITGSGYARALPAVRTRTTTTKTYRVTVTDTAANAVSDDIVVTFLPHTRWVMTSGVLTAIRRLARKPVWLNGGLYNSSFSATIDGGAASTTTFDRKYDGGGANG